MKCLNRGILVICLCCIIAQSASAMYDPKTGRFLSRDPLQDQAFLEQQRIGKSEQEIEDLDQEALQPAYLFTENDPVSRIDPNGLKDRSWPFNGRVKVGKKCKHKIKSVDIDNKKVYETGKGGSTPRTDDVDFVECGGKWYKIGAKTFKMDECCKCPKGFREATDAEKKAIDGIIKEDEKKKKKPKTNALQPKAPEGGKK